MDPSLHLENQSIDEFFNWQFDSEPRSEITYPDQQFEDGHSFRDQSIGGAHLLPNQHFPNGRISSTSFVDNEDDDHNDRDLSNGFLRYIDQILMEEDMEDKTHMLQESLDFQAKERSFYKVLGKRYPPSPQQELAPTGQYSDIPHNNYSNVNHHNSTSTSNDSGFRVDVVDPSLHHTRTDYDAWHTDYMFSNSTNISSSNSLNSVIDRYPGSPVSPPQIDDTYGSEAVRSFMKGFDDARKFLPSGSKLLGMNSLLVQNSKECESAADNDEVNLKSSHFVARGKKNQHPEENDCAEERSNKLPAVETESNVPTEEFGDVWIYTVDELEKKLAAYMGELQITGSKSVRPVRGSSGAKGCCVKKQNRKKQLVDLAPLLIDCAQSIGAGDLHNASEYLKQIRQHSSPFGNAHQRLAHYLADGLEARLAGTGSEIYKALIHERKSVPDYLKAYCLSLVSSSVRKISNFASNKSIMIKSEKAMRVHIIDFGISYGFQWPIFIQRVAQREGGPPKLRITGIDLPQPGSRPAERIKDTGHRLVRYAKMFNVPFEYNAIAQIWDTIKTEALKIEKGEFVAVTCSFRAKNLVESSRTSFLDLIRKIAPDIFIHAIDNGSYSGPFFVSRFREALFHFSALFDMLEKTLPGDKPEGWSSRGIS